MPIRNEASFIEHSLSAVLEQDYPHDQIEVLIADGMSTDATREIIKQLLSKNSHTRVRLLDNPKKIVPTGFNIALCVAQGEIIIRVDGHTIIARDYVSQCVEMLKTTNADNVGGRMIPVSNTPLGNVIAAATSSPFGVGGASFHYSQKQEWVDTVYMGAWRQEVFERIGKFDEEFIRNQDDEFNYRLRASGGKILLSPAIKSKYYNRSSLKTLWRQYFEYGFYKVLVMQKHPYQMRPRQFVPLGLVLVLLGGGVLSPFSQMIRRFWLFACALYVIANLSAAILTSRKTGRRYVPLLSLVFGILHLSYGFGFLVGLLRFANRWRTGQ